MTDNLKLWQTVGVFPFVTTALNGGSPFSYNKDVRVIFGADIFRSLVSSNTTVPTDLTKWVEEKKGYIAELLATGKEAFVLSAKSDLSGYEMSDSLSSLKSGRKNLLVNGDMLINQRILPIVPTVNNQYGVDQWNFSFDEDGGTLTGANIDIELFPLGQTDVPGNPFQFQKIDGNITGSPGGDEVVAIQNFIEDVASLSGEEVTLSFWVKGSSSGEVRHQMFQFFGNGGSPSPLVNAYDAEVVNVTTSWQLVTKTFTVPSVATKTRGDDGDDFLAFTIIKQAGATRAASQGTAGAFSFTGTLEFSRVQFEKGKRATQFEIINREVELYQCLRFFQRFNYGGSGSTIQLVGNFIWNRVGSDFVTAFLACHNGFRVSPTATVVTSGNFTIAGSGGVDVPMGTITVFTLGSTGQMFLRFVNTQLLARESATLDTKGSGSDFLNIELSAEL